MTLFSQNDIYEFNFLWTPKVKSRPRVTKWGTYTDAKTVAAEKNLADQYNGPLFEGPIAVELDFHNDRIVMRVTETTDYTQRKLRGDVDNFMKLVGDGLNKIAWADDKQIVSLAGRKF